jgi:hypothetical protein
MPSSVSCYFALQHYCERMGIIWTISYSSRGVLTKMSSKTTLIDFDDMCQQCRSRHDTLDLNDLHAIDYGPR